MSILTAPSRDPRCERRRGASAKLARRTGFPALLTLLLTGCGMTVDPSAPTDRPAVPAVAPSSEVRAVPVILPPLIDGRLEEGIWRDTPGYRGFGLVDDLSRPPRHATTVHVAYDAANLYVALACETSATSPTKAPPRLDDALAIRNDESCCIRLWPDESDPSVWYEVAVNCGGAVCDLRRHAGVPFESVAWNAPAQAEVIHERERWTAELRIPLKRLGVADRPWRISVLRRDTSADERSALHAVAGLDGTARWAPTRVRLVWPSPAMPLFGPPTPPRTQTIADMEDAHPPWQTHDARVLRSLEHALEGQASLRVASGPGGGWIRLAPPTSDFTGWDILRFGVYSDEQNPVDLGVRLTDVLGRSRIGWLGLTSGTNDIAMPLDLLAPGLQLRSVMRIEFVLRSRAVLWIDDVRLVEDTLSPHERPAASRESIKNPLTVHLDPALRKNATASPLIVVVDVPLYRTQRVRRVWRCVAEPTQSIVLPPSLFKNADATAPLRITACLPTEHRSVFVRRDVRPAGARSAVTFSAGDFPIDLLRSPSTRTAQP